MKLLRCSKVCSTLTKSVIAFAFLFSCISSEAKTIQDHLISFNAIVPENGRVNLQWKSAAATTISHFVIERSTDGENFREAAVVFTYSNVTGESTYEFNDNISKVQSRLFYYRIRIVDVEGNSKYSATKTIKVSELQYGIKVQTYPNPVVTDLKVTIPSEWQNKPVTFNIYNRNGQIVRTVNANNSNQTEMISVSQLEAGSYILKVTCGEQGAVQKIIKQ